jgi:zinc protease
MHRHPQDNDTPRLDRSERGLSYHRPMLAALTRVIAIACAGLGTGAALAATHEFALANGLKVIVHEDRRAPVVVTQIWYRVGASYEPPGRTGISHVLEHMMFKGTERYGPGEFSRIISDRGGSENAFTGDDYTAYFQTLTRDALELSFELESDRMVNLALPAEEFAREIEVVKEERRLRTEDDPQALAFETARAAAFAVNPYRQPVIGWMADLEQLDVDHLRDWYRRWYTPSNATLVVAGDADLDQVKALAQRYFAPIPDRPIEPPAKLVEPPQHGEKRAALRVRAELPYLVLDYKAPVLNEPVSGDAAWEPYALELLAAVLAGDDAARLPRTLVRERGVAAEIAAYYDLTARLPSTLTVAGVPATGRTSSELERELRAELQRLARDGVEAAEIERARTRLLTARLYQQDSVFYQAMEIGQLETVGLGWRARERYEAGLAAVTPAQVQAVASEYLVDAGLTVTTLDPLPPQSAP